MKISVRKTKDLYSILALNEILFPEDELNVGDNIFGWIAYGGENREQVGFCTCTDLGHNLLFLSRAGLIRSYRGRNIQKRFIRVRENFGRKNGFKKVITYVHKFNYSSLANLIKSGYFIYTPEWNYAGDGFIYLIKDLNDI